MSAASVGNIAYQNADLFKMTQILNGLQHQIQTLQNEVHSAKSKVQNLEDGIVEVIGDTKNDASSSIPITGQKWRQAFSSLDLQAPASSS